MKDKLMAKWEKEELFDRRILDAFLKIRRDDFIPGNLKGIAYEDSPLPIGHGQTISQPTTVMMMLNALIPMEDGLVLEIGSGSGYNAALLSCLYREVISIEPLEPLASLARRNLAKAGISNVQVILGDGSLGFSSHAPFDRIIVTCAVPKIPPPLLDQLKDDGIIVVPVGSIDLQEMVVGKKDEDIIRYHRIGHFRFVPLRGEFGYIDPKTR